MESTKESVCIKQNQSSSTEKKTEPEIASDRESSIESFHTNKSELSITTETELIDVDDIELSDEESWLYKSPKKLSVDEKAVSTYNWLYKDVEAMDDSELQATKTALITKLNQLKLFNSGGNKNNSKETVSASSKQSCDNTKILTSSDRSPEFVKESHLSKVEKQKIEKNDIVDGLSSEKKENDFLDVVDVQKIARLQEESLKQSTSRFLSKTERNPFQEKNAPIMNAPGGELCKPASIEALNTCIGKMNNSSIHALVPMQGMKKQSMFSSSATLHHNQELHRGSLPNINKGYCSLKSRKSKRPSDQKMPCPLPIYPSHLKTTINGTMNETSSCESRSKLSPPSDYRESRTLPSSYRIHARNSSSRKDLAALSPSPRRESTPFLSNQKNSPVADMSRRDSAPCNPRKYLSPVSSPTLMQKYSSSSALQSPTKSCSNSSQNLRSSPNVEYHRNTTHSPSRRLPLTTVHNYSPKRGNSPASPHNGDFRTLKLPSKIPSPAARSGIPVPSIPYISKPVADDETWSQDCF